MISLISNGPANSPQPAILVGLYEKALPAALPMEQRLLLAKEAGYDYLELSIDESEERLGRLQWDAGEREKLRTVTQRSGIRTLTMCLSAHRKYPMGGADPTVRARAMQILRSAIQFATDVGIPIVQVAGYDVFYEPSTPESQARFLDGLGQVARWAGCAGVMLGIENVDTEPVDSVSKALHFVNAIRSPWLQLIPDMGNLAAAGYDPPSQLRLGQGHVVGIHAKDTLPGMFRGVPFGHGIVPFAQTFAALSEMGFSGPITVEMWGHLDPGGDPIGAARAARSFVGGLISASWANRAPSQPVHHGEDVSAAKGA